MPSTKIQTSTAAPVKDVAEQLDHQKKEAPSQIVLSKKAGGNISTYPIVFTKDSKYFFSCVDSCVKIFSTATGAVVKVLSQSPAAGGHKDKITHVVLNPKNHLQLYTASLDGTIKLWDYNDDILLKTYNVNAPIKLMVMCSESANHTYVVVDSNEKKEGSIVYRFSFGNSDTPTDMRRICELKDCSTIDITEDGKWLAFGARYKVYVWPINQEEGDVPSSQLSTHIFVEHITVLKFHPHRPVLAVGDQSGKITHIANYTSTETKDHIRSTHHWHHLPVRCLTFMADGSYLLSGGEECVMVIWQLDTGHKQFLPRMGGAIDSITISPNHRFYCVGLDDNSIRLVNGVTQNIEQVIQGVQYAQADNALNPLSTGLMVEPRNHHLVLNGVQGSLQFYDANADKHVMDLQVVPMNRVTRSGEKEIVHAHVVHVAFLRTGEWMATVDTRDDKITTPELFLKFWRWNPDTQAYDLHTRVDYPHTKPITSLTFNPVSRNGPMAITTSEDKTFKVWNLSTDLGRNYSNGEAAWICRSVGVYRDNAPKIATFSEDGSILAVAFGQITTLWDPYVNSIQAVFAQPSPEDVEKLSFLGDNCPFLIATSKNHLCVWNILTCKVWWSMRMSVDLLAVDTISNQFATVRNHGRSDEARVTVFNPKSAVPIALQNLNHSCLAIAWLPKEQDEFPSANTLVYFSSKYEIIMNTVKSTSSINKTHNKKEEAIATPAISNGAIIEERSMLNDMYGKRENERETEEQTRIRLKTVQSMREEAMFANRKESKSRRNREEGNSNSGDVLSAPSHVLPSVEAIFDTFMSSIMSLRIENDENTASIETDTMDIDDITLEENETNQGNPIQINITNSALEDLPSLSNYFTKQLEQKSVPQKSNTLTAQESSSDDDSEEEDPSKIDW